MTAQPTAPQGLQAPLSSARAKESQHWYLPDGSPFYEAPKARVKCTECGGKLRSNADKAKTAECQTCDERGTVSGGMRDATLADARKCDGFYGQSSITGEAAAPGLVSWQLDQVALASMTGDHIERYRRGELDDRDTLSAIRTDAAAHGKRAAEIGTEIHADTEAVLEGREPEFGRGAWAYPIAAKLFELAPREAWMPEASYVHASGFGCKLDAIARSHRIIIDFKGRDDWEPDRLPLPRDKEIMQLAAQRQAANIPDAICGNLYFGRQTPGLIHVHWHTEPDLARGWAMFQALLAYRKAKDNYYPGLKAEA